MELPWFLRSLSGGSQNPIHILSNEMKYLNGKNLHVSKQWSGHHVKLYRLQDAYSISAIGWCGWHHNLSSRHMYIGTV